jgi:hypothetical protein
MRTYACLCAALAIGCGGLFDAVPAPEAGASDAHADEPIVVVIDASKDSAPPPPPPTDCDGAVQPQPFDAGQKFCPYQADGGTTCAQGDYCCEPDDGGAYCGSNCGTDFLLKCSGMNNGCFDGCPCCIVPPIERVGCFYQAAKPFGTTCGGVSANDGPYCGTGVAQICATSAECIEGTCAPLVLGPDTAFPIWVGVCVASDGSVAYGK